MATRDRGAITTWLQLGHRPIMFRSAATVGDIVSDFPARPVRRWHTAVVLLLIGFWAVAVGVQFMSPRTDTPAYHPHTSAASLADSRPAVLADHPHLQDGSTQSVPDAWVQGVLPRQTNGWVVGLVLIAAVATLAASWRQTPLLAVRGPPRRFAGVLTGRLILTRLCIARR